MLTCSQCGREFQPGAEGQSLCSDCRAQRSDVPQFETMEYESVQSKRGIPWQLYLHSPTAWLIAANVVVFLITCVFSRAFADINIPTLVRFGANYGPLTLGGQPWRLLTSTFLHGGFLHIALNMWALLNLGVLAEILFGRRSYTLMYLLCGIAASTVSVWWHFHTGNPAIIAVGASGAIFGIAGALIPALALQRNARLRAALTGNLTSIVIFVLYTVIFGMRQSHIDNSAHIGGLVCGLVLGMALPSSPGWDAHLHPVRRAMAFVLVSAAIVGGFTWLQKSQIGLLEFARAQTSYQNKDLQGAVEHLNKSLSHEPRSVESQFLLGLIYLEKESYEQARDHLLIATQIAPNYANAHAELCVAYLKLLDVTDALGACKRAAELDPKDPDKQFNLGLTQRANGDVHGALQSFTNAERLRPNGFDEEAMLGETLVDVGRTEDAIRHLRLAYKAKPNDNHVRMLLVRLLLNRGDREEARQILGR